MPRRVVIGLVAFSFALLPAAAAQATVPSGFTETLVASGMPAPTALTIAPDGTIFVAQQGGALRVIRNGTLQATAFVTLSVDPTGERGLLGVATDPSYNPAVAGHDVYLYYTATTPTVHNRVIRFEAGFNGTGELVAQGAGQTILDLEPLSATNHNGGAIHFGIDGKLYVAVGENAVPSNSQTFANRLGKMLRINPDGSIPPDNPYFNDPTVVEVNKAIWARGLRNPFTFGVQPGTGRIFINDVGAGVAEEINDGIAASNYGWPTCEGPCNPPNSNFRDPLFWYGHGGGPTLGCAIVGGAFYNPTVPQFGADYLGDYFFGDLCSGWIRRFDPVSGLVSDFASNISSLVDVGVANDGSLYYLARGGNPAGQLFRVTRNPTAVLVSSLRGFRTPRGVLLSWQVARTSRVLGFNVFRERARVNEHLLRGAAGASYTFLDLRAPRKRALRYRLEVRLVDGSRVWFGAVLVG